MKKMNARSWTILGSLLLGAALSTACGGLGDAEADGGDDADGEDDAGPRDTGDAPGVGVDYTFTSLDLSSLGAQSQSWCEVPAFEPAGYSELDKETFIQLLADYTRDWMAPLHNSLLGLNEDDVLMAIGETVTASWQTHCMWPEGPFDFLPPEEDLLDPAIQEDTHTAVTDFLAQAEEISSGETLRLSIHECEECGEPLGAEPMFLNARLTTDGVLVLELELTAGKSWSRTLYVTPDAVVVHGELAPVATWLKSYNTDTRSGEVTVPSAAGSVTAVVRKNNAGGISATAGVSTLQFELAPGSEDTYWVSASDCIGMHVGVATEEGTAAGEGAAQAAAYAGDLTLTIPGQLQCGDDCGEKERSGMFEYSLGDVSAVAEQPKGGGPQDVTLSVLAERASTASIDGDVFAEGGPGKRGQGGALGLSVDRSAEGFLVTFNPPLSLGGVMTISRFSDEMRLSLPGWLEDEMFDVTMDGAPSPSVFVPVRGECPLDEYGDRVWVEEPIDRREVEIRSGTLKATVGSGEVQADAGQCAGATLLLESELTLTSDWAEVGFECK